MGVGLEGKRVNFAGEMAPRLTHSDKIPVSMRKAILLYNPASGRRRCVADVETALSIFRSAGVEASMAPTRAAGDSAAQVKQAISEGCDTVLACGGDGTIHDIAQALVGTDVALGILPLGTANCLAHDLGLPLSPNGAARCALTAKRRRIAVGHIRYQNFHQIQGSRYFIFVVGIGADAHLFYKLNPLAKRVLGMGAYYAKATRLWLTHPMNHFVAEVSNGSQARRDEVSQLLAVRIREFGGVLRALAPGAGLDRDDLRLVLFHTRSRFAYLRYIIRGYFRASWQVPGIELTDGTSAVCRLLQEGAGTQPIFVEADGELLGTLPAEIILVPDALTILVPGKP